MEILHIHLQCRAAHPFALQVDGPANPGTTLQGLFATILGEQGEDPDRFTRSGPSWFPGPRTIRLQSLDLWTGVKTERFEVELRLVGREALRRRERAVQALRDMGARGLFTREAGPVAFKIERLVEVERTQPPHWVTVHDLLVEMLTPLMLRRRSRGTRESLSEGPVPWGWVLGNVAYSAAAIEWQESGRSDERAGRAACDAARAEVERLAESIETVQEVSEQVDFGRRPSATGRGEYEMIGRTGYATLRGELAPLAPVFHLLECWYAGNENAKGFGDLRLWRRA